MRRVLWVFVAVAGCGFATGCGESRAVISKTPNKDALVEVGEMLKSIAAEGRKPPGKLAELEAVEPMLPTASLMIREGTLVYLWGSAFADGSEKIVAYEKQVPTDGGWVLLQNGTVKEMTAAEFASARR